MRSRKQSKESIRERAIKASKTNSISSVAKMFQVDRSTIHRWVKRYEEEGYFTRRQKPGSSRPRIMNPSQTKRLLTMILKPASKYGYETDLWTSKRIREIAKKRIGLVISKTTMCKILFEEDYSYKKPEKRYYEANKQQQQEWKKKSIPKIKRTIKKYKAILYFEDEANIPMSAVLGKTWGPIGTTTLQPTTGIRGSISAMFAISQSGKLLFALHEKRIASDEVIHFLGQLLKHHKRRHLVVVMDQTRCHTSIKTKEYIESQKRLHVFYLPPRSPEFNPDEKVWNHLKNIELKSHQAKTKKELKVVARKK